MSSAIAYIVKQFVKLFVIQYGITFCFSMCTLYEAPLHLIITLSIRQLSLNVAMSYSFIYGLVLLFVTVHVAKMGAQKLESIRVLKKWGTREAHAPTF